MSQIEEKARTLPPEEFLEVADDGQRIMLYLNEDETLRFQETYFPAMVP